MSEGSLWRPGQTALTVRTPVKLDRIVLGYELAQDTIPSGVKLLCTTTSCTHDCELLLTLKPNICEQSLISFDLLPGINYTWTVSGSNPVDLIGRYTSNLSTNTSNPSSSDSSPAAVFDKPSAEACRDSEDKGTSDQVMPSGSASDPAETRESQQTSFLWPSDFQQSSIWRAEWDDSGQPNVWSPSAAGSQRDFIEDSADSGHTFAANAPSVENGEED
ncbi:hypothetical protein EV714DRAFT_272178 [Schizophyllum commune]